MGVQNFQGLEIAVAEKTSSLFCGGLRDVMAGCPAMEARGGRCLRLKIYLNGKMVPEKRAVVSVFDHGLLYGDGVFEGIRAYNGRVFKLDEA